ncbi:MAG: hydrogenase formation protein HypD [Spirochaetales bacterium]|nr:hydrogenase formation protein HypD [Spirochaetales bacterium]
MIRYMEEFRSAAGSRALAADIRSLMPKQELAFMEICGGHTLTALKYGLAKLLPEGLSLKSGPGCPVCVTPQRYIDTALALTARPGIVVATFGDMLRVPGTDGSLLEAKARGADIRICLSPLEAVAFAQANPEREVVFLGIGFETTAPTAAAAVIEAEERGLRNFSLLTALKTMPAAMRALLESPTVRIDGFICPGHVTAVAGGRIYEPLADEFHVPCVVSGFEPTDMLRSILMLLRQVREKRGEVENEYTRVVGREGNPAARGVMERVFVPADAVWRGLGNIPGSGLELKVDYTRFDADRRFPVELPPPREYPGCRCGDVMRGTIDPPACPLFARTCRPDNPLGACMVSAEGACGIHYSYRDA